MTSQLVLLPTYSGQLVNLLDPDPATIRIIDIVHSLSGLPRYLRHTIRTYSVMEHSLRLAMAARALGMPELVPECLLHDAHEGFLAELPRMIKHSSMMADYRAVEDNFDRVIRAKYGLPRTTSPWLKRMDRAICRLEVAQLYVRPEIIDQSGNGTVEDAAMLADAMRGAPNYFCRYGWGDEATASRTLAFIDKFELWDEDYFA